MHRLWPLSRSLSLSIYISREGEEGREGGVSLYPFLSLPRSPSLSLCVNRLGYPGTILSMSLQCCLPGAQYSLLRSQVPLFLPCCYSLPAEMWSRVFGVSVFFFYVRALSQVPFFFFSGSFSSLLLSAKRGRVLLLFIYNHFIHSSHSIPGTPVMKFASFWQGDETS